MDHSKGLRGFPSLIGPAKGLDPSSQVEQPPQSTWSVAVVVMAHAYLLLQPLAPFLQMTAHSQSMRSISQVFYSPDNPGGTCARNPCPRLASIAVGVPRVTTATSAKVSNVRAVSTALCHQTTLITSGTSVALASTTTPIKVSHEFPLSARSNVT